MRAWVLPRQGSTPNDRQPPLNTPQSTQDLLKAAARLGGGGGGAGETVSSGRCTATTAATSPAAADGAEAALGAVQEQQARGSLAAAGAAASALARREVALAKAEAARRAAERAAEKAEDERQRHEGEVAVAAAVTGHAAAQGRLKASLAVAAEAKAAAAAAAKDDELRRRAALLSLKGSSDAARAATAAEADLARRRRAQRREREAGEARGLLAAGLNPYLARRQRDAEADARRAAASLAAGQAARRAELAAALEREDAREERRRAHEARGRAVEAAYQANMGVAAQQARTDAYMRGRLLGGQQQEGGGGGCGDREGGGSSSSSGAASSGGDGGGGDGGGSEAALLVDATGRRPWHASEVLGARGSFGLGRADSALVDAVAATRGGRGGCSGSDAAAAGEREPAGHFSGGDDTGRSEAGDGGGNRSAAPSPTAAAASTTATGAVRSSRTALSSSASSPPRARPPLPDGPPGFAASPAEVVFRDVAPGVAQRAEVALVNCSDAKSTIRLLEPPGEVGRCHEQGGSIGAQAAGGRGIAAVCFQTESDTFLGAPPPTTRHTTPPQLAGVLEARLPPPGFLAPGAGCVLDVRLLAAPTAAAAAEADISAALSLLTPTGVLTLPVRALARRALPAVHASAGGVVELGAKGGGVMVAARAERAVALSNGGALAVAYEVAVEGPLAATAEVAACGNGGGGSNDGAKGDDDGAGGGDADDDGGGGGKADVAGKRGAASSADGAAAATTSTIRVANFTLMGARGVVPGYGRASFLVEFAPHVPGESGRPYSCVESFNAHHHAPAPTRDPSMGQNPPHKTTPGPVEVPLVVRFRLLEPSSQHGGGAAPAAPASSAADTAPPPPQCGALRPRDAEQRLVLAAVGRALPVSADRSVLDFGCVAPGGRYAAALVLRNAGAAALKARVQLGARAAALLAPYASVSPDFGYVQAGGALAVSVALRPRADMAARLAEFVVAAGEEGGAASSSACPVLRVPITVAVPGQPRPVRVTLRAQLSTAELVVEPPAGAPLALGRVPLGEAAAATVRITNPGALPQTFCLAAPEHWASGGRAERLPRGVTVAPGDGFGVVQPGETLALTVGCRPLLPGPQRFRLVGRTLAERSFVVEGACEGFAPPVALSQSALEFPATAVGDVAQLSLAVANRSPSMRFAFEFGVPSGSWLHVTPRVGELRPRQALRVQFEFAPPLSLLPTGAPADAASGESPSEAWRQWREWVLPCYVKPLQGGGGGGGGGGDDEAQPAAADEAAAAGGAGEPPFALHVAVSACAVPQELVIEDAPGGGSSLATGTSSGISSSSSSGSGQHQNHHQQQQQHTVNFGPLAVGERAVLSVGLINVGADAARLWAAPLDPAGPFTLVNALRPLPPGGARTALLFAFAPRAVGPCREAVIVRSDKSALRLALAGDGVEPRLEVAAPAAALTAGLDFGDVAAADAREGPPLTVRNPLSFPVAFEARPVGGAAAAALFFCRPASATLAPGEARDVAVVFAPGGPAAAAAALAAAATGGKSSRGTARGGGSGGATQAATAAGAGPVAQPPQQPPFTPPPLLLPGPYVACALELAVAHQQQPPLRVPLRARAWPEGLFIAGAEYPGGSAAAGGDGVDADGGAARGPRALLLRLPGPVIVGGEGASAALEVGNVAALRNGGGGGSGSGSGGGGASASAGAAAAGEAVVSELPAAAKAAGWSVAEPLRQALPPGERRTLTVRFQPPPSGPHASSAAAALGVPQTARLVLRVLLRGGLPAAGSAVADCCWGVGEATAEGRWVEVLCTCVVVGAAAASSSSAGGNGGVAAAKEG